MEDLRVTRSVELTVESIIEGRLVAPPIYREPDPLPQPTTTNNLLLQTLSEPSTSPQLKNWDNMTSENIDT